MLKGFSDCFLKFCSVKVISVSQDINIVKIFVSAKSAYRNIPPLSVKRSIYSDTDSLYTVLSNPYAVNAS